MINPKNTFEQSLQRRINFTGNAKYFWSSLFGTKLLKSVLHPKTSFKLSGIFLRLSAILCDLIESLRLGAWVKGFGDYRSALLDHNYQFIQHKNYPSYKYIKSTNTLIGLHIGVDLIGCKDNYYLMELNLDAAIRKYMRNLYPQEIDPIITHYVDFAKENGFEQIRLINSRWEPYFIDEVKKAKELFGIDIQLIFHLGFKPNGKDHIPGLQSKLQQNTLYAIFNSRHTPIEFLLHNKFSLHQWFPSKLFQMKNQIKRIKAIPGWLDFNIPNEIFEEQYWPQIAAKLSGWDAGTKTTIIKARDLNHAKNILGISKPDDFPKIFKMNLIQKIIGKFGLKNKPIYQKYIPLEKDEQGRLISYRMHAFYSPLKDLFLSTQAIHGSKPIVEIPYGIAPKDGSIISTISQGAFYRPVSEISEKAQNEVCYELGLAIKEYISEKFIVFED